MSMEFPTPGKKFKRFKQYSEGSLTLADGSLTLATVIVYINQENANFAIPIPQHYKKAWEAHPERMGFDLDVRSGCVMNNTFEGVQKDFRRIAGWFKEYFQTSSLKKIIVINFAARALRVNDKGKVDGVSYNEPSFPTHDLDLRLDSNIAYLSADNSVFTDHRHHEDRISEPTFDELNFWFRLDPHVSGSKSKTDWVPYTDEAWETIKRIEAALYGAVITLKGMLESKDRIAILNNPQGFALLAAPKA